MRTRRIIHSWLPLASALSGLAACQISPPIGPHPDQAQAEGSQRSLGQGSRQLLNIQTLAWAKLSASSNGANVDLARDGNLATCWSSGLVSNPTFTGRLSATATLTQLNIKVNPVGSYAVDVSNDGLRWRTVLTGVRNSSWNVESKRFPSATNASWIRLRFSNNRQNVMLFEWVAMGTPMVSPQPSPTATPTAMPSPSAPPTASPTPSATTSPAPSATPMPSATPTPMASGSPNPAQTRILVDTTRVLHAANSFLLGTNRNHVESDFPNGAAKLAKMRELSPTWGQRRYLYRIGHGPTDGRNDYSYMTGFHFEGVWNKTGGYPYDDLRYSLKDANTLGAEQMHVVNYGTGTPEEAGRYVSFLNRAGDANRARYPYAQQNVRLFELGNEIPWTMVRGHDTYAPNESVYAQRAKLFAQQMRANSDVPIQIGAVASINSNWLGNGWSGGVTTVKNILQIMGDQVDFLIYHGYPSWPLYKSGDLLTLMAQNEWNRQKITNEIQPAIRQYGAGRDIRIANTEFFTHLYNDVARSRGLFGALYAADSLSLAFNLNLLTSVEFCFEHKELADAAFFFNNDPNNTTAIFKFQKMLAEHWGDQIVQSQVQGGPSVKVAGAATSLDLPKLAVSASSRDQTSYVMVVHRLNDADVTADVALGWTPSRITRWTLSDPNGWNAANASLKTETLDRLEGVVFPKSSVTILEITR
ncbi:MAG: discoidin domain-containing protein [Candidatus Sericytochromatia bacterium]|nr:discoidin domain-containing protein [Candidatus Sericytochromatia bacterium]